MSVETAEITKSTDNVSTFYSDVADECQCEYCEGYHDGSNTMLNAVRASLHDYPLGGGDSIAMGEVDRIVNCVRAACVTVVRSLSDDEPVDVLRMNEFDLGYEVGWATAIEMAAQALETPYDRQTGE